MGNRAASCKWVWGKDPGRGTSNAANNLLNSTGAGAVFNCQRWGESYTFYVETNDSGVAYQIRTARNSSGPWAVVSSASYTSTGITDIINLPGPLMFVSPRVDALASTVNYVVIEMTAVES